MSSSALSLAAVFSALDEFPIPSAADPIHRHFEAQAMRTPHAVAVIAPDSESLDYEELNRRANKLARHLQAKGAGPDTLVGVCFERSLNMVVSVLAVLKAGAAYVPLDPNYPSERLDFMLEDSAAPIILTEEKLEQRLPKGRSAIICIDHNALARERCPGENPAPRAQPDDLAYVIYTSGSTGRPKGVAMRQGALVNLLLWQMANWSFNQPARVLQFASLNFDVSFQEIFSTWCSGGTLLLVPEAARRNTTALLEFVRRHQAQRLFLPFIALKHLAEAAAEGPAPESLREVITAGEQLKVTPAIASFFTRLEDCTLENQYGPSEAHVVTSYRLEGPPDKWPALPSIGRPISNTEVLVLTDDGRFAQPGQPGELHLGGVCLARGYLNRPELTAAKFIAHPFSNGSAARLYRTGDLGRILPDGNIEFLGRLDDQVKVAGIRVEPGEIEAVLLQHPGVKEAVVMARDTASGDKQLAAYFVRKPSSQTRPGDLRAFLNGKLPPHLVPSLFLRLDTLPLNPNGKVDRRALPDEGEPEEDFSIATKPPQTPLEMQLQMVFERFFRCRPIGVDMNFFELGGDSLQALNLIMAVEQVTGKKLPMGILFQAPTIEKLARALEQETGKEWSIMAPLQPLGKRPPLFLVHTTPGDLLCYGNLVYHLGLDQPCYGFQSLAFHHPAEAHTRIEQMAACYIKLMRSRQPEGPYFLSGWCYGGIVAVEMAHQLLAAGQKVAFLGLIETPAPAPGLNHPGFYFHRLRRLLEMNPAAWKKYLAEKIQYYRGAKTARELRFQRIEPDGKQDTLSVAEQNRRLERLEAVYAANIGALKFYSSRPYPGRVTLFNASQPPPGMIPDPDYAWTGLAREIETFIIPGNHDSILFEPQARILARKLRASLDSAHDQ